MTTSYNLKIYSRLSRGPFLCNSDPTLIERRLDPIHLSLIQSDTPIKPYKDIFDFETSS
jgi:hypothetical protein